MLKTGLMVLLTYKQSLNYTLTSRKTVSGGCMKRLLLVFTLLLLLAPELSAEELSLDLRFESTAAAPPGETILSVVKSFKGIKLYTFTDSRSSGETFLGELKVNGQQQKIHSKTALSAYATDAFRKTYSEWGGKITPDGPFALKGEITQFAFEETEGYQARIGFHFFLLDGTGKVLWDGHSSGIVRGTGKTITPDSLSGIFSDILRATYLELLEDNKLVGVWTGRVSNTYVIRDEASLAVSARNGK